MADFKLTDNSDKVRAALEEAKEKIFIVWAGEASGNCADELEMTPRRVDTGRLKGSIDGIAQKDCAVIFTNVEYAV